MGVQDAVCCSSQPITARKKKCRQIVGRRVVYNNLCDGSASYSAVWPRTDGTREVASRRRFGTDKRKFFHHEVSKHPGRPYSATLQGNDPFHSRCPASTEQLAAHVAASVCFNLMTARLPVAISQWCTNRHDMNLCSSTAVETLLLFVNCTLRTNRCCPEVQKDSQFKSCCCLSAISTTTFLEKQICVDTQVFHNSLVVTADA